MDHLIHLQILPSLSYYQLRPKFPTRVSSPGAGLLDMAVHTAKLCSYPLSPLVPHLHIHRQEGWWVPQ